MNITLRKANTLQNAINDAVKNIDVTTEISINEFQDAEQEVLKIKERYNIMSDAQFPDISRFDPVAQVIGLRPGQVCEITRSSKTAIETKYYRVCI